LKGILYKHGLFFIITVIDNIKFLILGRRNKPSPH